ncbi:MAG: response regulator [Proteobacteria bacterium]|nr:response regulator [Pseudomonadota bacterium]
MLDSTVELFALRAHAKNLEIPTYIDADIPESLIGDEGRIRQIMLNLISNAIKFTEDGGVAVEVSVSVLDARNDRTVLHFAVTDTGIGIPDDKLESIFKQFEQADGSTTRQYGGTGLGLAICKNLVTLIGGEIGVEQRPEGGSVFWFTVPFERPEAPESWSRDLAQSLNGRRVLVVDDNAVNRLVFERQLSALGANVTVATGAESAVRKIGQDNSGGVPFDLMIIDHMMPGTDGLDLAEIIRALPGSEDVRLVLSSSSGQFNSNAAVHKHGFDAAPPKPLRPGALIRCIGELDKAAPASRTEQSLAALAPPPDEMPDGTPAADGVLRILVAEDNQINQMLITSLLKTKGYVIDLADNGAEAVDMLRSQPYDIVLMDIQMPEMDGIAATRKIRTMDCAQADIPIIAVSAHAMQSNRNEALGAGMNDYLTKPIDKNELFEKVARWAPSRAMPDDAAAELRQRTIAS